MNKPRVLIVGGGFAGLSCALRLDPRRFAVTVIDQRRHFEFIPHIHELISGVKRPSDLRLPLATLLRERGHRFRRATATSIDVAEHSVTLDDGSEMRGEYLVIATGSSDADFGVAGVARHTLPLKSVDNGSAIAQRLNTLQKQAAPHRVVVVGAGLAGVEVVGELLRRKPASCELCLVEAQQRPLPGAPTAVSQFLEQYFAQQGVALWTSDPVARVSAKTVWLQSGARLRSDATIWTGGPAPPPLLADSFLAEKNRWLNVNRDLSLPHSTGVFVAGDTAQTPKIISRQAYFALDMGSCVAANIACLAAGRNTVGFRALPRPTLMALGDRDCVLIAGNAAFAGKALMAAKESIYALVMSQLDRRRPRKRIDALLQRSRNSYSLLWPLLRPRDIISRDGRLRRLKAS